MRRITNIIIHCAATPPEMDIGVEEIDQWHRDRGWKGVGYHFVIRRCGLVEEGRSVEEIGAHVKGHNTDSIGICLVGGKNEFDFTRSQLDSLDTLVNSLLKDFPGAAVKGHNDFDADKACPRFNVQEYFGG
jgi:N-acetylmuramoyl-L-alanine amidase